MSAALVSSAQGLNDVIVIGYGTTKRKDATGSLTTVSSKEFNQGVITSPDQLLANKVSGLEVTRTAVSQVLQLLLESAVTVLCVVSVIRYMWWMG